MIKLEVLNLALEAIELLRPIVARIKKHDRSLARQIADAANSSVLTVQPLQLGAAPARGGLHRSRIGYCPAS